MQLAPKSFENPNTFFCRAYGKRMSIFDCMASFVDANALKQKDKPCHGCAQGQEVRAEYSGS